MSLQSNIKDLIDLLEAKPYDPAVLETLFEAVKALNNEDISAAHDVNKTVRKQSARMVRLIGDAIGKPDNNALPGEVLYKPGRISESGIAILTDMEKFSLMERFAEINRKGLLFDAPVEFDPYLQYIEANRPAHERFYLPRRKILKPVVDDLQMTVDGELDETMISMPTRVGKTTLLMLLMTWIIGRSSEMSNLYSAYSDIITSAFYRGVLEILNDPTTYLWRDVFPSAVLVETNAKDETLNIDRKKRYPSLTCRSLYGTLNGACDCSGFLIADDLIGGIEEALNKDRLVAAWSKVENNLLQRAKESAKIIWVGTRWSMVDPIGLRLDLLENDEKHKTRRKKVTNLPALNENDESNFDYTYGVGFSTEYYHQRRASFERNNDLASWFAQFMGEPIERTGTLFAPEDMLTYNGELPPGEPDRIFMAIDPSWGGGNFVAGPICKDYDGTVYVDDVVYSNAGKDITRPIIVEKILKHGVQAALFEANKMTADYPDWIEKELRTRGYRLNIMHRPAPNDKAKEARIHDKAPEIREFVYRSDGCRSKEYSLFMQSLFSFKLIGKNQSDDAPDSLAIVVDMMRGIGTNKVQVRKRTF